MAKKPKSPTDFPQTSDAWYFAIRRVNTWIESGEGEPVRPYLQILVNLSSGLIMNLAVVKKPDLQALPKFLHTPMTTSNSKFGIKAGRPAWILFEDAQVMEALKPGLEAIGVKVESEDHRKQLDELIKEIESYMSEGEAEVRGLLSVKNVTVDLVGDLFAAAADYYRAAPWVQLSNEDFLAVRLPSQKKPYYVCVMGQGGVEYGLALYKSWEDIERTLRFMGDPLETISPSGSHAITFNEVTQVPFDDLDAIEQYGWPVVEDQAYPVPLVFIPPDRVERPGREELIFYTAALRAIPVFVRDHWKRDEQGQGVPVMAMVPVSTLSGEVAVEIVYPAGELPTTPRGRGARRDLEDLDDEEFDMPFDQRVMEGEMARLIESFQEQSDATPLRRAQELIYQAFDEPSPARRITLARKALKLSPDCADAYVILAEEEAETVQQALEYYQQGVQAGQRALGEAYFKENTGRFWGLLETRPFMRAMEGVAGCLWEIGRKDEALEVYQEMLRLNPGDNQGIRYVLVDLLLNLNRFVELEKLISKYRGDWSAVWNYTEALLAFRKEGASQKANRAARSALKHNPFVLEYLTGKKRIPNYLPENTALGDDSEAVYYAAHHLNYWRREPGAVEWLAEVAAKVPKHSRKR